MIKCLDCDKMVSAEKRIECLELSNEHYKDLYEHYDDTLNELGAIFGKPDGNIDIVNTVRELKHDHDQLKGYL